MKKTVFNVPLCNTLESSYLYGLFFIFIYQEIIHKILGLQDKLPFLPLMIISVYCALGMFLSWLKFYQQTLTNFHKVKRKVN